MFYRFWCATVRPLVLDDVTFNGHSSAHFVTSRPHHPICVTSPLQLPPSERVEAGTSLCDFRHGMAALRKVVVFGATGNTGLCSTQAAVQLGYEVTAFVRNPAKLPEELASKVTIKVGDVLNTAAVDEAVEGQDAVVILLGRRNDLSETTVLSSGTMNILSAMDKYGVKRVSACLSAFNFWEKAQVPERFYNILSEHERMVESLKSSKLEWIAVLPPHITDEGGRGDYTIQEGSSPGRMISKHDLGNFMVSCLADDAHLYKLWGICDKPQP